MTPDDLRARLLAAMRVSYAMAQAERPEGLTASLVGGCHSAGARAITNQPRLSTGDVLRALRGKWIHDGLQDMLAEVDPGFRDGRAERFTWTGYEPYPVTGEWDFALDDAGVEVKTRDRDECRWHADHGALPQHAIQVSLAAEAEGFAHAFVVYLPTDSGVEEMAVCPVDIAHWAAQGRAWMERADVRDEIEAAVKSGLSRREATRRVLDGVDRDSPSLWWCRAFCGFASDCRGEYVTPVDLEIPDPTMRTAAQEAEHWRQVRLDARRREEAAKAMLRHVEGVVHDGGEGVLRVDKRPVAPSKGRRGYVATTVERRPE